MRKNRGGDFGEVAILRGLSDGGKKPVVGELGWGVNGESLGKRNGGVDSPQEVDMGKDEKKAWRVTKGTRKGS